jgi:hypothetical protein
MKPSRIERGRAAQRTRAGTRCVVQSSARPTISLVWMERERIVSRASDVVRGPGYSLWTPTARIVSAIFFSFRPQRDECAISRCVRRPMRPGALNSVSRCAPSAASATSLAHAEPAVRVEHLRRRRADPRLGALGSAALRTGIGRRPGCVLTCGAFGRSRNGVGFTPRGGRGLESMGRRRHWVL